MRSLFCLQYTLDLALIGLKMNEEKEKTSNANGGGFRSHLTSFFTSLVRDFVQLIIAFVVGSAGGALVCWYYGIPLVFSIAGGILVLGIALALTTDTWFD
jgi:hypothetical protein